jgi:hypothetical protein
VSANVERRAGETAGECKTLTNMSRKHRISFQSSQVGINQRPNKLENGRLNLLLITIEIIEKIRPPGMASHVKKKEDI